MKDNKCSDCTNDKGCVNCEGGNMHEVKKKEPEGALKKLLDNIDPIEYEEVRQEMLKEAASEDLEKAADAFAGVNYDCESESDSFYHMVQKDAFKAGANWQKEQMEKKLDENALLYIARQEGIEIGKAEMKKELDSFWKPADGDDLPEIDREVVVLYQRYPLEGNEYAVCFAHRPKEFWDGKNIATGEVTRYYPKKYDKGGWNSPDIRWWLDLELPINEEE